MNNELAQTMGNLQIGDQLSFSVDGIPVQTQVQNRLITPFGDTRLTFQVLSERIVSIPYRLSSGQAEQVITEVPETLTFDLQQVATDPGLTI